MASPAAAAAPGGQSKKTPTNTTICASFIRKVCLQNWWLIKVEMGSKGGKLAVGGFAIRERQETRVFCSAAIVKRHDTVTLETTDGITITVTGFINRSRTVENGFSYEVCNHFSFGFPYNWEEYAGRFFVEESVDRTIPSRISSLGGFDISSVDGADSSLPICLDDIPVTRVRDLLMSESGVLLGKSILNDIMQKYGGNDFKHEGATAVSDMLSKPGGTTLESAQVGTPSNCNKTTGKNKRKDNYGIHPSLRKQSPRNHSKSKVDETCKDDGTILYSIDRGTRESEKIIPECETGVNVDSLGRGVTTRSMTRLNNLRNMQEKNLSPNMNVTCRLTEPASSPEASRNQNGWVVNRGNTSSKRNATIFSDAEVEADKTPDDSTVKRLSRLKSSSKPFPKSETSNNQYGGAVSEEEMNVKQSTDKSAVRRSARRRKQYKLFGMCPEASHD